jgi:hypothetical protein
MKRIIMTILVLPVTLFGYVLLRYRRNCERASRFYDSSGHPQDDGTRLVLPPVKTLEVLPLIDWYRVRRASHSTSAGVSTWMSLQRMARQNSRPCSADSMTWPTPLCHRLSGGSARRRWDAVMTAATFAGAGSNRSRQPLD